MTATTFRRSGFVRPPAGIELAAVVGGLDASVTLAYLLGINPIFWHVGTMLAKMLLAVVFKRSNKSVFWVPALFIATIIVILTVEAPHIPQFDDYIQVIGFLVQIALTLFLVEPALMPKYAGAGAWVIVVMAAIHMVLCLTGGVSARFGRYFYLGDTHPNLGGEINAAGAFLAAYALPRKRTLAITAILVADCMFVEARAALIVCFVLLIITAVFDDQKKIDSRRAMNLVPVFLAGILVVIVLAGTISSVFSDALMLDDPYRGLQSGFSGRDAVWGLAIQLFEQNPVFGTGFGYFDSIKYVGPHNIVLFALAENGLAGLLVLGEIFYGAYVFSRRSWFNTLLFASTLPLLMFNDRYLNLNPYPLMLYVTFLSATMVKQPKPRMVRRVVLGWVPRPRLGRRRSWDRGER